MTDADTEARAVLATNLANGPNGIVAPLPPTTPVYAPADAGDPAELMNGILISGGDIRVAVQNTVPYTFGRAVGMDDQHDRRPGPGRPSGATSSPSPSAGSSTLPGPNAGATAPCDADPGPSSTSSRRRRRPASAPTATRRLRSTPNAGAAFDPRRPGATQPTTDRSSRSSARERSPTGPRTSAASSPSTSATSPPSASQLFYNDVTSGTQPTRSRHMEAAWISAGGYPGPMFPPATTPPDPNDQVAVMSGNATGIAIDAVERALRARRRGPGRRLPGPGDGRSRTSRSARRPARPADLRHGRQRRQLPGGRNQSFTGQVALSTVSDTSDPANPMVLGTLVGSDPIDYDPNPSRRHSARAPR